MSSLARKHILLGVTGGIAAYKAAELTRRLRQAGAEVRVAMTAAAQGFVTPLTFQALSGHPVHTDLMDPAAEAAMGHIELARWADAVLVAPCTADFMARLVQGEADDLLATLCLASRAPLALAPAMNPQMWAHPATRANREALAERGVTLLGPAAGEMACGETGEGRMLEPEALLAGLAELFETGRLAGRRVVVTAGPTREPIDPVRYISNRSSGRMGFAVAEAAAEAGAEVVLIAGPVALETPARVTRVDVETAAQMHAAVMKAVPGADVFIATAAVADYRVEGVAAQKIKKTGETLELRLTRNPDILADVAAREPRPFVVGFAAETERLIEHAREKLDRKGLDLIAANPVGEGQGFDTEDNCLELLWAGGQRSLPRARKSRLARELVAVIAERLGAETGKVIPLKHRTP
ncbi:MAG TPA: bifunctional phosphopantothenoylcysteine decarboxylase/phosphopantothenate--cysteine ligase CoaBC [Thioalkalivibrio sp.]|nr:bifunctional phosphopantothenoylcysteine decarboxylase/phosphopantothenate--cysteine ligase CoaBC [Thioalkalivibrio sp.]